MVSLGKQLATGNRRRLLLNALSLYAVQGCTYLLPLLTFPYVARVLGPTHWGAMAFAMSVGTLIVIAVEYGFNFSATRETARIAGDRKALQELVAGVLGAKLLISVLLLALVFALRHILARVAPSPLLLWSSAFWGVGQGINMLWYFQGLQRMTWSGALDVTGKVVATLCTFLLVRTPDDAWKVAFAQAVGCSVSHAITVGIAFWEVGFCWPRLSLIHNALRMGWSMFVFRLSDSLLGSMDGIILGYFGSPLSLGLYLAGDKIRQVSVQTFWPITQTLFPHQTRIVRQDFKRGAQMVRRSLLFVGGSSVLVGAVVFAAAPLILRCVVGSTFVAAAPSLRFLAFAIPLQVIVGIIAFQWLVPLGLDRQINRIVLCAGLLNVALGITLSRAYGASGMSAAFAITQGLQLLALGMLLRICQHKLFRSYESHSEEATPFVLPKAA